MPAKVFIICGQANPEEKGAAGQIKEWLGSEGFDPYVAVQTQSIQDVNSCIIGALKDADYYVFIDFRREQVETSNSGAPLFRGSLFTHQELAIAYALGFEHCVFLKQNAVKLEGIGQYILSNADSFDDATQVLALLKNHVTARGWTPKFSRFLCIDEIHWSDKPIPYSDHTGQSVQRVLFGHIHNRRSDVGAIDVAVRLVGVKDELGSRDSQPVDRSNLKWAGHPAYSCIIRPKDYESVSLLAINMDNPHSVFLHSALDVIPRRPILSASGGAFSLTYEAFAQGFPILRFSLHLVLTGDVNTIRAELLPP